MRASASLISSPAPLALAMALCGFAPAQAGEAAYCVTCQGPDQTYLCRVNGDEVSQSDAVKLYCVVRTAKEGGHTSCAAHNATACNGIEKHYSYNGPSIPDGLAEDPRVKKFVRHIEKDQQAFDKDEKRKSLVEVTGEALSASRRGWRNMRASLAGREEANQSPAPISSVTSSHAAAQEPLPELPHGTDTVPLSAAPTESASPPPERKRGVGSFARNTYRCVRSLFRRCGSDASGAPN